MFISVIAVSYTHLDVYKRQAIPLLITFNDTCFLIVLFRRPVAPINTMLLIGKVGNNLPHLSWILSNSVELIIDTFAPVSIISLSLIHI